MPEPIAERLSRFTPDGTGLDRDALLFAAGRASARPSRRWMALCGALAASQLLTVLLFWPRIPAPREDVPVAIPRPPAVVPQLAPAPVREGSDLLALRNQALAAEGDLPLSAPVESMVPPEPPLRAFTASVSVLPD